MLLATRVRGSFPFTSFVYAAHPRLMQYVTLQLPNSHTYTDPAQKSSFESQTHDLAFEQTLEARKLLYRPGHALLQEMALGASSLSKILRCLTSSQVCALGARLFGPEGILSGHNPLTLPDIVDRLANNPQHATANERIAFMEIISGIGSLLADAGPIAGTQARTKEQEAELREALQKAFIQCGLATLTREAIGRVHAA